MSNNLKLKTYNQVNSSRFRKSEPTIRFHEQGQINISKESVRLMNLEKDDRVEFHQNQEDEKEWYVCKSLDGHGFPLRVHSKNGTYQAYTTNNATVVRAIMRSIGVDCKSVSFKISSQPIQNGGKTLFLIITSDPKINQS